MNSTLNFRLSQIWSESAKRWRKSSEDWKAISDEAGDCAMRGFADQQSDQAAQWAAEDEARATELLK